MKKKIGILGSTGSIGRQTLDIIERFPDRFEVVLLSAYNNSQLLYEQISKFKPQRVAGKNLLSCQGVSVYSLSALENPDFYQSCDLIINGISGIAGLLPSIAVLQARVTLATANKESIVAAGEFVLDTASKYATRIIPVDSEHSALMQCICGEEVSRLIITASGGAFRDYTNEMLSTATYTDALKHPTWDMGSKVTIDSATLMNKGFELVEAKWLFGVDDIDVLLHRESVVHAMAVFRDGTTRMCLSRPDMHLPIQYALTYPERAECLPQVDINMLNNITFSSVNIDRFPCLKLGFETLKRPSLGAVLVAADEVAVSLFASNKIGFLEIPKLLETTLGHFESAIPKNVADVLDIVAATKNYALNYNIHGGIKKCY
ncbi:MAG: 1-deoxy-D-xylulose-5-phosphate reductoisomerase [Christensenellaceae bacterium]|jgi:1-deoxy-D-xylulose-5-phosphate reductoisomerase|nr:1-deoxy-D-xylulose-5-phosphate reductoisomerase [Christensenellaceae bacterium]